MKKFLFVSLILSTLTTSAFCADSYSIDSSHSRANFEITRIGHSKQNGSFNKTSGKVTLDFASKSGSVDFTIHTTSIDMGSAAWNAHLSDPGLFNVKMFPTMTFKSSKLIFEGDKVVAAEGQFTMIGVTKPLKIDVHNFQCGKNQGDNRQVCSGEIAATLKRSDFGLTKYIPAVSDEVTISVPIDAYKD
jgi:polyisoprenoid-binding protein YceI